MKVIISAAGTAGHINPALAIANKIKEEDKDSEILFIGTDYGLENELVTKAGYNLKRINAYGFSKKITFENFKRIFQTITSIFKMKKIIKEFGADIVIGTGGYICGPTFYAADSLKIPMLLHESNGYPGMAVKMFDGKAKILLGFESAKKYLKHKENVVTVGNPTNIRKLELSKEERTRIFKELGLNENIPTIVVTGGSQGARKLNESILELIKITKNEELGEKFQIIFATRKK
jgi:UDP-N-acetylglucosamine--N-acetylmuramyl-(pentapeptide) pyrophosphoryl-undecaprenol N-acetylglucosamine transferase